MPILALPVDVQLAIYALLDVEDVLSLQRACRVLHGIGRMDYVWHHLKFDLPLDLAPNKTIESLRSDEIQRAVVKALRLRHNWLGNPGRPTNIRKISHEGIIQRVQLLGDHWLVAVSRTHHDYRLAVCSLRTNHFYEISDAPTGLSFAACLQEADTAAVLAKLSYLGRPEESLDVYSLTFHPNEITEVKWRRTHTIRRPNNDIIFNNIQVYGHIVMASAVQTNLWRLVFFVMNSQTGAQRWLYPAPDIPSFVEIPRYRLSPAGFVTYIRYPNGDLVARRYDIPAEILSETTREPLVSDLPTEYNVHPSGEPRHLLSGDKHSEYYIPKSLGSKFWDHIPVAFFPSDWTNRPYAYASYLPIGFAEKDYGTATTSTKKAFMSTGIVSEVSLGETGRYAVWLHRHQDDSDDVEILRGAFSPANGSAKVMPLLPPQDALPFEVKRLTSLTLDEATGRVCIGLFSGEIYLLSLWAPFYLYLTSV